MSFHFVLFYVCRLCLHLLVFQKISHISGSRVLNRQVPVFRSYQAPRLRVFIGDRPRGGVCLLKCCCCCCCFFFFSILVAVAGYHNTILCFAGIQLYEHQREMRF